MYEVCYALTATAAEPYTKQVLALPTDQYSKLSSMVAAGANDNATATVQLPIVLSRAADPMPTAGPAQSGSICRGDPLVAVADISAGRSDVISPGDLAQFIWSADELLDGVSPPTLGIRAVGLESNKTAYVDIKLKFDTVAKSNTNVSEATSQMLRFQQVNC